MRILSWFVPGLVALGIAAPVLAQRDPTGTWSGQFEREGSTLEVEVVIAIGASGYAGTFSSKQLRAVSVPLSDVRFDDPRVRWRLVGDATITLFEGILDGDGIAGRLRDGDDSGTFRLRRRSAAAEPLEEESLSFTNGPVSLSGTVIYPGGPGPFPGIVFLHGSGAENRSASRFLANEFARRGVAALVYDKRGVGSSRGDWRDAGFAELVGDAAAAIEALRARPRISADRVGIHGHSQGGTIAPWVAAECPRVAFVVASAAGGVSMSEMEAYSVRNLLAERGSPEADRGLAERYARALASSAYEGAPRDELMAVWREVRDRPWAFAPPAETDPYWSFSARIASYDPLAFWARVAAPALLVYGEADERVPARESASRIADAYLRSRGSGMQVLVFPEADHGFRRRPAAKASFRWPTTVEGYPDRLIDWVLDVVARPAEIPVWSESPKPSPQSFVTRFLQAFDDHDVEGMLALAHPDVEWLVVSASTVTVESAGSAALGKGMRSYFASMPTVRAAAEDWTISGRFVAVRERTRWRGPDGHRTQSALSVYEVEDGGIRRVWYFPAQP